MKRRVLKPWVQNLLIVVFFITMIVAAGECYDIKVDLIKFFITLAILLPLAYIQVKYGRDE